MSPLGRWFLEYVELNASGHITHWPRKPGWAGSWPWGSWVSKVAMLSALPEWY